MAYFRLRLLFAAGMVAAGVSGALAADAGHWETQYFFDQNLSRMVINDLKFPSAKRGIAAGTIVRNNKTSPMALLTSDGGARWTQIPLKEEPLSLFFLDDSVGWMVTDKGLWQTEEAGRSWKKLPNFPKDLARVYFTDRKHGWAVGDRMQALETTDGGTTWNPIAEVAKLKVTPDFTSFGSIVFGNPKAGIIAGWNTPPRKNVVPDWMDPGKASTRRTLPSTLVLLQTLNGGETWQAATASIFGRVTRVSMSPAGDSLGLIEFDNHFQYPSEVFRFHAGSGDSSRVFRKLDRLITDVLLTAGGATFLAGSEVTAVVRDNPIPGKLKIIHSSDDKNFEEMPVDYRATAHRAIFAAPPVGTGEPEVWVATDTGMILKLVRPGESK